MGNISKQIESLEEKLKNKNFTTVYGIGGIVLTNNEEINRMIDYQWSRIRFLESLLVKTRVQIQKEKETIFHLLCNDCRINKQGLPCEEDFFNQSYLRLIEDII